MAITIIQHNTYYAEFTHMQFPLLWVFAFSKFYHRHTELIFSYSISLQTPLQQGISEPIFYVVLVYKFVRIVDKPYFSEQFKTIFQRHKNIGDNMDIVQQ